MSREDLACDLPDGFRPALQVLKQRKRESSGDLEPPQFTAQEVLAPSSPRQRHSLFDLPHAVALQVVEGEFGVDRLPRRAELLQQAGERLFQPIELNQAGRPGLKLTQRIEDEKRLMRSPLLGPVPYIEAAETPQQLVGPGHGREKISSIDYQMDVVSLIRPKRCSIEPKRDAGENTLTPSREDQPNTC